MTLYTQRLIYPEGDIQEITHRLKAGQLVDLNGSPLEIDDITDRMIVYRVHRQSTRENVGEEIVSYFLELIRVDELDDLIAQQLD